MPIDIVSGPGSSFSAMERDAFIALVLSGGEVSEASLRDNVPVADTLVFLRDGRDLHGVAALKFPSPEYREGVWRKTHTTVAEAEFPLELGYILVVPAAQGRGHSSSLVEEAVRRIGARGVYATSRSDNAPMHRTLARFGFQASGRAYPSRQHPGINLQLFLRSADSAVGNAASA